MKVIEINGVYQCDCGFSWKRGQSGSHSCGDGLRQQIRALVGENTSLKEVLEYAVNPDNAPEYHRAGMGCGVEDRGYQKDGYNACEYGWDSALDRMYCEVLPDVLPETPETCRLAAELKIQGIESAASIVRQCRDNICAGGLAVNRQSDEAVIHPYLDSISDELDGLIADLRREAK